MIADLHCHYPMHLFPQDDRPRGGHETWLERLRNHLQSGFVSLVAPIANDAYTDRKWRVDLDGLEAGGAKLVCSVLYWPPAEWDFSLPYGSGPLREYFVDVEYQIGCVEKDIAAQNQGAVRARIAKRAADLPAAGEDPGQVVFVHCLEGALHLGPGGPQDIDARVRWLAKEGVFYITVAHLFYRQVATNAPAIPVIPDSVYRFVFPQPDEGLTALGEAVVRAMQKYRVAIDITHMSTRGIEDTFALMEELEGKPTDWACPIIATHAAMREAGPDQLEYNLTEETAKRISDLGGLIGLIMAQHELGKTEDEQQSKDLVCKHLEAIAAACGSTRCAAFGTDIDGFIKPTIKGIEEARDLAKLTGWVEECRGQAGDAQAILHENALRVIRHTFEGRERAFEDLGLPLA